MLHLCSEKYRLELHWRNISHQSNGITKLYDAVFTGPVLTEIAEMREKDSIDLDFTPQHNKILSDFHIARFSWFAAERRGQEIKLGDSIIASLYENEISTLENDDYIIIDCSNHTAEKHTYNLLYKAYIVKSSGEDKYGR